MSVDTSLKSASYDLNRSDPSSNNEPVVLHVFTHCVSLMNDNGLERLLLKLDGKIRDTESLATYDRLELYKLEANIEYARKLLIQQESASDHDDNLLQQRRRIKVLKQTIDRAIEDIKEDTEPEVDSEPEPEPILIEEPAQLSSTVQRRTETGNIDKVLQQHRQVQDEVTSELLNMARSLKASSVEFSKALDKDNQLVADTDVLLGTSSEKLKVAGSKLGRYRKTSSVTWWRMLQILVSCVMISVVMYFVIVFTRFL
jgi:hypothetical protein